MGRGKIAPMDLTIRPGESRDAKLAAELWLRARRAALGVIPAPVHSDDDVRSWFATWVVGELQLWVAEDQRGDLFGILVLDRDWIVELYVDPTRTGLGIGSGLVDVAKRERPGGLRLWTFVANTRAQRFYERHGFVEVERTDGSHNEERAPDIRYAYSSSSP